MSLNERLIEVSRETYGKCVRRLIADGGHDIPTEGSGSPGSISVMTTMNEAGEIMAQASYRRHTDMPRSSQAVSQVMTVYMADKNLAAEMEKQP